MTLKVKILRIIIFTMEEFGYKHSHLFTLILEELQDEHLRYEKCNSTNSLV